MNRSVIEFLAEENEKNPKTDYTNDISFKELKLASVMRNMNKTSNLLKKNDLEKEFFDILNQD